MLRFLNPTQFIKDNTTIFYKILWDQVLIVLIFTVITYFTYEQYNFPETDSIEDKMVNSLYFNSATQFSVGYGDFTPTTNLSKIINIIHHLIAYFILATEISFIFKA